MGWTHVSVDDAFVMEESQPGTTVTRDEGDMSFGENVGSYDLGRGYVHTLHDDP